MKMLQEMMKAVSNYFVYKICYTCHIQESFNTCCWRVPDSEFIRKVESLYFMVGLKIGRIHWKSDIGCPYCHKTIKGPVEQPP